MVTLWSCLYAANNQRTMASLRGSKHLARCWRKKSWPAQYGADGGKCSAGGRHRGRRCYAGACIEPTKKRHQHRSLRAVSCQAWRQQQYLRLEKPSITPYLIKTRAALQRSAPSRAAAHPASVKAQHGVKLWAESGTAQRLASMVASLSWHNIERCSRGLLGA